MSVAFTSQARNRMHRLAMCEVIATGPLGSLMVKMLTVVGMAESWMFDGQKVTIVSN